MSNWPGAILSSQEKPPLVEPSAIKGVLKFLGFIASLSLLILVSFAAKKFIEERTQEKELQIVQEPTQEAPTPTFEESHPTLFVADLEYDPANDLVTQHSLGTTNGHLPVLLSEVPTPSPEEFIYKVEVVSEKNELFQSGWVSVPKEVILTPLQTLRFHITSVYKPNAFVRIYLPGGRNIWTGKI